MTETGLILAEAGFLVLLYLFIWSIVRSSTRELRAAEQPRVEASRPTGDTSQHEVVAEPAAVVATAPPPPQRERESRPALELGENLHPRLVVERSPSLPPGSMAELDGPMTIGRGESNGIAIADAFVSHMHAKVFRSGQFFFIEDLGSSNGTFLNGRRLAEAAQLKTRDEIRLGETILRYEE